MRSTTRLIALGALLIAACFEDDLGLDGGLAGVSDDAGGPARDAGSSRDAAPDASHSEPPPPVANDAAPALDGATVPVAMDSGTTLGGHTPDGGPTDDARVIDAGTASEGGTGPGPASDPVAVCDEPAPWPVPESKTVVGNGTAASCTVEALKRAVQSGGLVTFACGAAPLSITVPSAIQITSPVVIDGAGRITLDGAGTAQVFVVASNKSLSARRLRFIRGRAPASNEAAGTGGAISGQWRSRVEVIGCTFEDNTAGRGGGAVSVWTGSSLTVVGSRFVRNHSWYGGAIYSLLSPLTVINSEFVDNVTLTEMGTGDGGAIGTDGASEYPGDAQGGKIELCGASLRDNRAQGLGGAAYLWVYPPDRVVIDRTTIAGNQVTKNAKGTSLGGGMRVSNGDILIQRSSFLGNSSEVSGGALYLDCAPTCAIANSTFHANQAGSYGGAIFGDKVEIANVTFAQNSAGGHGGALFGGQDWTLRNSVLLDNKAGNPWNQAYSCGSTGQGDHVLQWQSSQGNAGQDRCIADVIAQNPKLSAPAAHGGPTLTLLPSSDSPVRSAGAGCEALDQRGETRNPAACDLGAVEVP